MIPCGMRAGNVSIESCHTEGCEIGADALAAKLLSNGVTLQRPCLLFCFEVLRSCSSGRRRVMCSGYCSDLFARQLRRHTPYNHYHIINIKIINKNYRYMSDTVHNRNIASIKRQIKKEQEAIENDEGYKKKIE